jgi:hypothetical protein
MKMSINTLVEIADQALGNFALTLLPGGVSEDLCRGIKDSGADHSNTLVERLLRLSLLPREALLVRYRDLTPWRVGGAETYIAEFEITFRAEHTTSTRHVLAKAIVTFHGLDDTARIWSQRMDRLALYGVKTPEVCAYWQGTLFQSYIPYDFETFFRDASGVEQTALGGDLVRLAERVDSAGFRPIALVHNLRTDGQDIYLVDVGEDLGHFTPRDTGTGSSVRLAKKWLTDAEKRRVRNA